MVLLYPSLAGNQFQITREPQVSPVQVYTLCCSATKGHWMNHLWIHNY